VSPVSGSLAILPPPAARPPSPFALALFDAEGREHTRIPLPFEADGDKLIIGRGPIMVELTSGWPALHKYIVYLVDVAIWELPVPPCPPGQPGARFIVAPPGGYLLVFKGRNVGAMEWMA
jgi:hypothetical protein